ncbi:MAG: kelch repeat-containing protein [Planctomycetota bacterium]
MALVPLCAVGISSCTGGVAGGGGSGGGGGTGGGASQDPGSLQYSNNPVTYVMGEAIAANVPTLGSGVATSYTIAPALPSGLSLDASSGVITGTPTAMAALASYFVTASNVGADGETASTERELVILITDALPAVNYPSATIDAVGGSALAAVVPTSTGGGIDDWSIAPALPAGLTLDTGTGQIAGTPTAVQAATAHSITASNESGSDVVSLTITVAAPALTIDSQPARELVAAGATATFAASGQGTGVLSYQWLRDGAEVSGAQAVTLTTLAVVAAVDDGALYQLEVSDTFGSVVVSDTAELAVVGGQSVATTPLPQARARHAAVALGDGSVLLAGGYTDLAMSTSTSGALRFDSDAASYSALVNMSQTRSDPVAPVRLGDGRALISGNGSPSATIDLYRRDTNTFSAPASSMAGGRRWHTATRLRDGRVLFVGGDNGGDLSSAEIFDSATDTFASTGSLTTARSRHRATLLKDGSVLVSGGDDGSAPASSCERYEVDAGTFAATGAMATARRQHFAVALADGRVLVGGGTDGISVLSSVEVYDPDSGTFAATGSLASARNRPEAKRLANGRVLVLGGESASGQALASCEVYDPVSGTWLAGGSLQTAREELAATALPDGRLLVAGGEGNSDATLTASEIYDPELPSAGLFAATGSPSTARSKQAATLLHDGRVLVAGGGVGLLTGTDSAEIYDPATGSWQSTGSLATARVAGGAVTLDDGSVLVAGGSVSFLPVATAEIYAPATGVWTATGSMTSDRLDGTLTLLADGRVLAAGGQASAGLQSSAERYARSSGTWSSTGSMVAARRQHAAVRLHSGLVLMVGGFDGADSELSSCELYDPIAGTFAATGSLATARSGPVCTLLANGKVLALGGGNLFAANATVELYDPDAGTWSAAGTMTTGRMSPGMVLLPDGQVLIAGGTGGVFAGLASAELYDPDAGSFTATGSMAASRQGATLMLLPGTGRVLVAGGGATAELYR